MDSLKKSVISVAMLLIGVLGMLFGLLTLFSSPVLGGAILIGSLILVVASGHYINK